MTTTKGVQGVYDAPEMHWVGDGFPVRPMLSPTNSEHLDPFLMLDYAAPMQFEPTRARRGVGQHPHRGFETVTVVYQGELEHRDSTGAGGTIGPGDIQWMTAASGILHEEFHSTAFAKSGGAMEMMQLWVNLPAKDKSAAPGYQTLLASGIPNVPLPGGAGKVRVIAGAYDGHKGPAHTFTAIDLWDVSLTAGKSVKLAFPEGHTAALALMRGDVSINATAEASAGQLAVLERAGTDVTLSASSDAAFLVMSGKPIGEPVAAHGPFVMNTVGEIKQAMLDFRNGKFGAIA
jgi:quercetin 2,3-dioxygenase